MIVLVFFSIIIAFFTCFFVEARINTIKRDKAILLDEQINAEESIDIESLFSKKHPIIAFFDSIKLSFFNRTRQEERRKYKEDRITSKYEKRRRRDELNKIRNETKYNNAKLRIESKKKQPNPPNSSPPENDKDTPSPPDDTHSTNRKSTVRAKKGIIYPKENFSWSALLSLVATFVLFVVLFIAVGKINNNQRGAASSKDLLTKAISFLSSTINDISAVLKNTTSSTGQLYDVLIDFLLTIGVVFATIIIFSVIVFSVYFLWLLLIDFLYSSEDVSEPVKKFSKGFKSFFFKAADDVMRLLRFIPDFLGEIEDFLGGDFSHDEKGH